jgi:hypothetical protein
LYSSSIITNQGFKQIEMRFSTVVLALAFGAEVLARPAKAIIEGQNDVVAVKPQV